MNGIVQAKLSPRSWLYSHFMKLLLKTKPRLWPSQWRLQATVLTNAHQANLKNFIYWTRNKQMYFSLPAWWSNSWSLQTNRHWSTIWSRILHRRMKIVDQYLVPHRNSENHALQKGNLWNDMKFCKIEDRVRCQTCFKYQRPGETFCTCGSNSTRHYRGSYEAGWATNQQSIHHVRP